jgi:thioredoxin 1
MAVRVNGENFDSEVLQADGIVLVDFYSDSCVPCKRMSPVLAEIEESYTEGFKLVKVNINFDAELAEKYGVQAAPTFVFFKGGEEQARIVGAVKKSELTEKIDTLK